MVFTSPHFEANGCYYGVLNVLDPSVHYDQDGKVISVLRLPAEELRGGGRRNQQGHTERNENQTIERNSSEYRDVREIIVVETVESTQSPEPESEPNILDVTAVDDQFQVLQHVETTPDEDHVETEYNEPPPTPPKEEPIPLFDTEEEESTQGPTRAGSLEKSNSSAAEPPALNQMRSENSQEPAVKPAAQPTVQNSTAPAEEPVNTNKSTEERTINPTSNESSALNYSPVEQKHEAEETRAIPTVSSGASGAFVSLSQYEPPAQPEAMEQPHTGFTDHAPEEQEMEPLDDPIFVEDRSMLHVVDYREATPLFKAITKKNWQGVLYYLRTGSFSFSPLSSADKETIAKQAQTWVAKKDELGNEMWRQLPLHSAICFGAPMKIIEKLIQAYPEALKSPDCHGNLPLHHAFIFDSDDCVTAHLMKVFPASIHVMNFQGLQPIQCSKEVSSETFQSNAELFGALSDYTRAVAENDPDRLMEQLQDVKTQLKAVNDTLFATAPQRKPEPIKELMRPPSSTAVADYSPSAFFREIGMAAGICPMAPVYDPSEQDPEPAAQQPILSRAPPHADQSAPDQVVAQAFPASPVHTTPRPPAWAPEQQEQQSQIQQTHMQTQPQSCRVMEYCPKTKTWKEV